MAQTRGGVEVESRKGMAGISMQEQLDNARREAFEHRREADEMRRVGSQLRERFHSEIMCIFQPPPRRCRRHLGGCAMCVAGV